jgi:outer membrane protein, heavy metal efflux system
MSSEFPLSWFRVCLPLLVAGLAPGVYAQETLNWKQIKEKFEAANPTLKAAQANIDESRASEITAYLRPNPDLTVSLDQFDPITPNPYRPFTNLFPSGSVSYLHEREHKRELRLESAKKSTAVAESTFSDQERTLLFTLRNAFVQTLQAKAVLQNATDNLTSWDRALAVNRNRFKAGDLAEVDLDRLELQRVQFESDFQTAQVNMRTSKIQLLQLLNDRTAVDKFDITGPYAFTDRLLPLEEFHNVALETRPDLRSAAQNIELSRANHQLAVANGSTDPTFNVDVARNPPISAYFGFSVTIPLRLHDRNQGEKLRTQLDIGRTEKLRDASEALVFSDVDSAYVTMQSTVNLLKAYEGKYLKLATDVRDKTAFSFQHGGTSLLDYLEAEKSYRDTRLAYLNLIGSYLTAAAQMNLAAGREVIP